MTLNDSICYKFEYFLVISQIWEPTTAKPMTIDLYRQRRNCSPLNAIFSGV